MRVVKQETGVSSEVRTQISGSEEHCCSSNLGTERRNSVSVGQIL